MTVMAALRAFATALALPEVLAELAARDPLAAAGAKLLTRAIQAYDAAAPSMTLEQALGLACRHGGGGHWERTERRQARDAALRTLAGERFPHLSTAAAARALHAAVRAQHRTPDERLATILDFGLGVPGVSGLRRVLSVQEPLEFYALDCIETGRKGSNVDAQPHSVLARPSPVDRPRHRQVDAGRNAESGGDTDPDSHAADGRGGSRWSAARSPSGQLNQRKPPR